MSAHAVCHAEVILRVINVSGKADIFEELCKAVNMLFFSLPDII